MFTDLSSIVRNRGKDRGETINPCPLAVTVSKRLYSVLAVGNMNFLNDVVQRVVVRFIAIFAVPAQTKSNNSHAFLKPTEVAASAPVTPDAVANAPLTPDCLQHILDAKSDSLCQIKTLSLIA